MPTNPTFYSFLLAVSHYAPHGPIRFNSQLRDAYKEEIEKNGPLQTNAGYAAMIEALDTSVGQLLDHIDGLGLSEKTLVLFLSDNGGQSSFTNNAPLRGGKGTLYEGGVRIPTIARWVGRIAPGQVSADIVSTIDWYPTIASLTHSELPVDVDGIDLTATLLEPESQANRARNRGPLFWHYPHYHAEKPSGSILKEGWKLIEWFETGDTELFHLSIDPYEENDLAKIEEAKNKELLEDLQEWRRKIHAQHPSPNEAYNSETAHLTEAQLKRQQIRKEPTQ